MGEQIQYLQEKNDGLQKQYDGLDFETVKRNAEEASKQYEAIQEALSALKTEETMERVKAIEAELAKGLPAEADDKFDKEYAEQMTKYLRKGVEVSGEMADRLCQKSIDQSVFGVEDVMKDLLRKDMLSSIGPTGGYFILPDRASTIVERIFETSPIRSLANMVTTSSNIWEQPLDDEEFDCGWVEEQQARPVTATSTFGMIKIPVAEQYASPRVTQRMLDDAGFNVESWMNMKVADKMGRKEANSFVVGDGAGKPKGFLSYPAWVDVESYERHKVAVLEATGTAGKLDNADDLKFLKSKLLEPYQTGAVWGMTRQTFAAVSTLKDDYGQYLLTPMSLREADPEILLGKRIVIMGDMPEIANNAYAVIYADFSEFYTIVDRFGIRVLRDPYTEKPHILLYTTRRVGGAVTNYQAGKILEINAS